MLKRVALTLSALLLPAVAWGGSFIEGIYTSNVGYTIRPPDGWIRLDASNAKAMRSRVPENISIDGIDRFDVVFFPAFSKVDTSLAADNKRVESNRELLAANPRTQPEELAQPLEDRSIVPEFSPSVSVIVLNYGISSTSREMVKAYEASILENVPSAAVYAKDFKILDSTKDTINAEEGFVFSIRFNVGSREISMEQTVMSMRGGKTYIITCTSDANEYMPRNWCKNVVSSIKFK